MAIEFEPEPIPYTSTDIDREGEFDFSQPQQNASSNESIPSVSGFMPEQIGHKSYLSREHQAQSGTLQVDEQRRSVARLLTGRNIGAVADLHPKMKDGPNELPPKSG